MAANHIPVPAAQAALSLLSLSAGSSSTPPASHSYSSPPALGRFVHTPRSTASVVRPPVGSPGSHPNLGKRRPSSAAQTRRRTSDAASAAASVVVRTGPTPNGDSTVPSTPGPSTDTTEPAPSGGKVKKGTIFKCETCSKVYRHPNCLVKHRWEHSPHWREASKFLLSKHQQVQMLEAAAILSHISPAKNGVGTSLPEDRSLWPAYLSGGLLPMPGTSAPSTTGAGPAPGVTPVNSSTYREQREMSVSTSAIDDEDNVAISGESSDEDEREDSGYGSSSAAPAPPSTSAVAVPGHRQPRVYAYGIATSVGGHEYTLSSSHAACDAGAHMGSMAMGKSLQQSVFAMARSISASSFGVSSLRGGRDDEEDYEGEGNDGENTNAHGRPKWDEDESMAMDMDL